MNNEADNNLNYKYSYENWIDSFKDYDFELKELDNYLKEEAISSDDYNLIREKQEKTYDNTVTIRFRYLVNLWKLKIKRFPVKEREAQRIKEIEEIENRISKPYIIEYRNIYDEEDIKEISGEKLKNIINRVDVYNEKKYSLISYYLYEKIEESLKKPQGRNFYLNKYQEMKSNLEYKYFLYNYNVDDANNKETANIALSEGYSQESEEEDLRTKIISAFDEMCPKEGWKSGFMYKKQFYGFVDLLVLFFEKEKYSLSDRELIMLKQRNKVKVAKILKNLYYNHCIDKLRGNSAFFELMRLIVDFKNDDDKIIYKLMIR